MKELSTDRPLPPLPQPIIDDHNDGLNFYRSVSRHEYGTPDRCHKIKEGLFVQYLAAHSCVTHPFHDRLEELQTSFKLDRANDDTPLAGSPALCLSWAIEHPDLYPCVQLWELVASLLSIRLEVTMNLATAKYGPRDRAPYCICIHQFPTVGTLVCSTSVAAQDKLGHNLLAFISQQRQRPLKQFANIKVSRAEWWEPRIDKGALPSRCTEVASTNEYRQKKLAPRTWIESHNATKNGRSHRLCHTRDPDPAKDVFQVYTLCIKDPQEIKAATDFLLQCLDRAPCQRLPALFDQTGPGKRTLKSYMGVDAEFIKRKVGQTDTVREFVSVLSFAVDRHFVACFYILDMLDHPNEHTVSALQYLYQKTIFDPALLKVWHNFQSDMQVLETTINFMHQEQSPRRDTYYCPPFKLDPAAPAVSKQQPNMQNNYFRTSRPESLHFPRHETNCPMHNNPKEMCPCETGNIELAALFAFVTRDLGFWSAIDPNSWRTHRDYYNYGKLLTLFLGSDPLYRLLAHFKDPRGGSNARDIFYQSLGPGMELEDYKLSYNIGDVVGIALMFKLLTAPASSDLLALRLYQQESQQDLKLDPTEPHFAHRVRGTFGFALKFSNSVEPPNLLKMTYPEHDAFLESLQRALSEYTDAHPGRSRDDDTCWWNQVHRETFDATRLRMPGVCFMPSQAVEVPTDYRLMIPAGSKHRKELVHYIHAHKSATTAPPAGLRHTGSRPPGCIRYPGSSLGNIGEIVQAMRKPRLIDPRFGPPPSALLASLDPAANVRRLNHRARLQAIAQTIRTRIQAPPVYVVEGSIFCRDLQSYHDAMEAAPAWRRSRPQHQSRIDLFYVLLNIVFM